MEATDPLQILFDMIIELVVATLSIQFGELFTFIEILQSLGLFV